MDLQKKRSKFSFTKQSGQAYAEYIVVLGMVVAILFAPVPALDNKNAVTAVMDAMKQNYAGYKWAMSLPE
jgi:hypothetical protein